MCMPDHPSYRMYSCLSQAPVYIAICDDGSDRTGVVQADPPHQWTFGLDQFFFFAFATSMGEHPLTKWSQIRKDKFVWADVDARC
jgi:hypothetical protein